MSENETNEVQSGESLPEQEPTAEIAPETTVSDASDAREPGALSDQLEEVLDAIDEEPEAADVPPDPEAARKRDIKRNMAANNRRCAEKKGKLKFAHLEEPEDEAEEADDADS